MKTILIVDDIFENLYLLRVLLEGADYAVIEANDGKDALEKLHKNTVDLIISDILMPVMDGYMLCQACKKDNLFKDIPFVFYTSTYTEKPDEDFALKLGAAHFLRKPTDPDKILKLIREIFVEAKPQVKPKRKIQFNEKEVLKLYSKRLISKLEQKNLDLEKEIFEREKAETKLINENDILELIANNAPIKKVFDHIIINYESHHYELFGSISLLEDDGMYLNLISAPTIPEEVNFATKRIEIGKNIGSCGTAAFIKKPVIVSDISTHESWVDYKDIALKHNLKSCWSVPILSENKTALGTFAIYSTAIKNPTLEDIQELNSVVNLAKIAIVKFNIMAEVKKRDESYKSLVNQANDGIITYSAHGVIYDFNKATYTTLGYSKNEFSNLKIQDFIVGDFVKNPGRHKKILKGKSELFERQLICKNGTLINAEISAKLQKDGKILGIIRDITDRKKAELKLRENEKSLSEAQKIAKIGSYNLNLKTKVAQTSKSFNEIVELDSNTELTTKIWRTITHPEDSLQNEKVFEESLVTGEKLDLEYRIITKTTKKLKWIHGLGEIIYVNGEAKNFIGTIQDITESKQNEIALKAAKEFTDKLVMSMQEGLLIVDLKGEIIMVNDSLCEILGYSKEEFIGLNLPYPFAKTEDFEITSKIKDDASKGKTKSLQLKLIKKNGEEFIASFLSGSIKNNKGEVIALFGTVKDISDEERAKKVLEDIAKKSTHKKNVIMELSTLVGSDYHESLKEITVLSATTLNVGRVSVWKFDKDRTNILCEKLYNLKTDEYESGILLSRNDNPYYFDALAKNQTISIEDALNNDITKGFAKDYLIPFGITAMLDVFIQGENGIYGVICFEHIGDKRKWTADDEEFATSIASIVSLMVESTERKIAEKKLVSSNTELLKLNDELSVLRDQLEQENIYLRNELDLVFNYEEMVYGSVEFSDVLTEIEKVAPTTATVLLLGESGTGKELLARAIHKTSLRNNKPLIKVNCSAIPRELIESELFGHKKGSFTGAINDKIGKFELADGGTLFLDEIGELPIDMQPKILRFLQEGEIEIVGGTGLKKLDVRVIAATNRNLIEEIEKKQFREDLYFRLNVFPIEVPPLRNRKEDIPLLVEHFVDKFNKTYDKDVKYIPEDSMTQLKSYSWPGNIRELENLIERALILSNNNTLVIPGFETSAQKDKQRLNNKDFSLDAAQRNHILQILEKCKWKISGPNGAAVLLELKPSTLRDKMTKLGIVKPLKK